MSCYTYQRYHQPVKPIKGCRLFRLSIKVLEHGWAELEIVINEQILLFFFEAVPVDALGRLLESGFRAIIGYDSKIIFPNGSQKKVLTVKILDNLTCKVLIDGLSEELSVKQYVRAVLRMFDKYTHAYSKEEYIEGWNGFFPSDDLVRLRRQCHSI